MLYAKLNADGTLDRYPYTLTDLRFDNKQTSFPQHIDHATAAEFGTVPVEPAEPPAEHYTVNLERTAEKRGDAWVEVWRTTPATQEQIAERTAAVSRDARAKRDELLTACDWTQLPDALAGDPLKALWTQYRQALRDVPEQAGFPFSVSWPVAPG